MEIQIGALINVPWLPHLLPYLSVVFAFLLFELLHQLDLQAVWLPRSDRKTEVVQIINEVKFTRKFRQLSINPIILL
jgi:hypothetical protein